MAKYKAIKNYTDRVTGKSVWEGMTVEMEDDRAKIMTKEGFVEPVKTAKKKEVKDGE